jgi:hypothetical protein
VTTLDAGTRLRTRPIFCVTPPGALLPSLWQGWRLVRREVFSGHARSVARALQAEANSAVLRRRIGGDVATVVAQRLAELEAHVATLQTASPSPAAAALATAADVPALLAQLILVERVAAPRR